MEIDETVGSSAYNRAYKKLCFILEFGFSLYKIL